MAPLSASAEPRLVPCQLGVGFAVDMRSVRSDEECCRSKPSVPRGKQPGKQPGSAASQQHATSASARAMTPRPSRARLAGCGLLLAVLASAAQAAAQQQVLSMGAPPSSALPAPDGSVSASSEQDRAHGASHAMDGNNGTVWTSGSPVNGLGAGQWIAREYFEPAVVVGYSIGRAPASYRRCPAALSRGGAGSGCCLRAPRGRRAPATSLRRQSLRGVQFCVLPTTVSHEARATAAPLGETTRVQHTRAI